MIGNTSTIGSNTAYASGNLPTKRSIDNIGFGSSKLWFFLAFCAHFVQYYKLWTSSYDSED